MVVVLVVVLVVVVLVVVVAVLDTNDAKLRQASKGELISLGGAFQASDSGLLILDYGEEKFWWCPTEAL